MPFVQPRDVRQVAGAEVVGRQQRAHHGALQRPPFQPPGAPHAAALRRRRGQSLPLPVPCLPSACMSPLSHSHACSIPWCEASFCDTVTLTCHATPRHRRPPAFLRTRQELTSRSPSPLPPSKIQILELDLYCSSSACMYPCVERRKDRSFISSSTNSNKKKHFCLCSVEGVVLLAVSGREPLGHPVAGAAHAGEDQLGRVRAAGGSAASIIRCHRRRAAAQLPADVAAAAVVLQPFGAGLAAAAAATHRWWWWSGRRQEPRRLRGRRRRHGSGADHHVVQGRRVRQQRQRAGGVGVDHPGPARRLHHRQGARRRQPGAAPRQVQVRVIQLR